MIALIAGLAVALTSSHQIPASPGLTKTQANIAFKPESRAGKIRRLLAQADLSNPSINPPLVGSIPWTLSTAVASANQVSNGGLVYLCTASGTTASSGTGPTGYGNAIADGSASWAYVGMQTAPTLTIGTTQPAYLSTRIQTGDSRIRYLGCASPIGLGGTVSFPCVTCGLGGNGGISNGAIAGATNLANGQDVDTAGWEIVTDAPILCFQVGNSTTAYNVIVRDAQTNSYISSYPVAVNTSQGDNYYVLDFSSINSQVSGGGAVVPMTSGASLTGFSSVTPGFGYNSASPPDVYFYGTTGSIPTAFANVNSSGQLIGPTIEYSGNITGGTLLAKIVTGRKRRKISILTATTAYFKAMFVSPIDTIWASNSSDHETIAFLGDSWTSAVGVTDVVGRQSPMCTTFAQLMGADNWIVSGAGSTDYSCPMCPFNSIVTSGAISNGIQTISVESPYATMGGGINYPLLRGDPMTIDDGLGSQETVVISAVSGSNITAAFHYPHGANAAVSAYVDPFYCRTVVTSGAITASGAAQTITVSNTNNAKGSPSGIAVNSLLWVDPEGSPEVVKVTAVSGTSITGVFTRNHVSGCSIGHTGNGYRVNHFLRESDVGSVNADIIVIGPAGLNDSNTDNGASTAVIQHECAKLYIALRASNPYTPILWYGINATSASAQSLAVEQGIYNAIFPMQALDPLLCYVPVLQDPNGSWGATFGYSNGYLNPSTGHPTGLKGFTYFGARMLTDSVRNFFRLLATTN